MNTGLRRAPTLGGFTLHLLAAAWLLCGIASPAAEGDKPQPGGSLEFPARVFDRGNANVLANSDSPIHFLDTWPELLVGDGGRTPWVVEYDIDLPVDATYTANITIFTTVTT